MKINWTAVGVLFGIFTWVVTLLIMWWNNAKKETRDSTKLQNQVNLCLKLQSDLNKKVGAYFRKLDIVVREMDVLWAVFEERTGRMPMERENIREKVPENGDDENGERKE